MEGLIFGILRYNNGDMPTNKTCTGPLTFKSFKNSPEKLVRTGRYCGKNR